MQTVRRLFSIILTLCCLCGLIAGCDQTNVETVPSDTLFTEDDDTIKIESITKISGGQDGAIFQDLFFRFNGKGSCSVYDLKKTCENKAPYLISTFSLDLAHTHWAY